MTVLHVFDMDGTLLRGSSAPLQVARAVGCEADLMALERRYVSGEIDTVAFAVAVHRLWRELTPDMVSAAFATSPWLAGIAEVCEDIRRHGERCVVITMSPDFFAAGLLRLGFDEVVASRFPPLPFTVPIDPTGILAPTDKVRIVRDLLEAHGIDRSRCVGYGDSLSDAPLFRYLDATVAVNADASLADLAAASYRGGDLVGAYRLGRSLLGDQRAQQLLL